MKLCKHRNWEAAGHPYPSSNNPLTIRQQSAYDAYCKDCGNFVSLLSGKTKNNKGLIKISDTVICKGLIADGK